MTKKRKRKKKDRRVKVLPRPKDASNDAQPPTASSSIMLEGDEESDSVNHHADDGTGSKKKSSTEEEEEEVGQRRETVADEVLLPLVPRIEPTPPTERPSSSNKKDKKKRKKRDKEKKKMKKRQKVEDTLVAPDEDHATAEDESPTTALVPTFPFPVDPDDHCESPLEAYRDIVPLLRFLRNSHSNTATGDALNLYDPYYCNGAVIQHLTALGFPDVYNVREDCYAVWDSGAVPPHDVLVTNPPYSGDHIERLLQFVVARSNACCCCCCLLLLPQWVHKKDYFRAATAHLAHPPFYLVPRQRRYVYTPPPSFRAKTKSDVHKQSSPFVSMWYIFAPTPMLHAQLLRVAQREISRCDVARSRSALRDLRRKPGRGKA